ncbi:MAG TPA: SRPBCC family protein [Candidatus Thermoplasmatota archaeon]|nr:SRPBCC family protein [Candidatus Thermoplasmatota archaeon]
MRIENRSEIRAPVERVYDALTDLDTLPRLIPDIQEAHVAHVRHGLVGTRLDLTTREGRHTQGEIKQCLPRRSLVLEDARGIREELNLHGRPDGRTELVEVLTLPDTLAADGFEEEARTRFQQLVHDIEAGR